jgi:hypothetical protein
MILPHGLSRQDGNEAVGHLLENRPLRQPYILCRTGSSKPQIQEISWTQVLPVFPFSHGFSLHGPPSLYRERPLGGGLYGHRQGASLLRLMDLQPR